MKNILLLGLFSFFLVGCAGGPKATADADNKAKQFIPPSDNTANLYIYRNENFGGAINMDILIDNERIATTGPKTYIMANLQSGDHKIEGIAAEGTSILNVKMLPNTNKFIWQEVKMGAFAARNLLQEVSEEEGKKGVLESSLLLHSNPSKPLISEDNNNISKIMQNPSVEKLASSSGYSLKKVSNKTTSKSRQNTRKVRHTFGSSCDCGYGYCYGPRGGRYCITSSGNKSYQ